MSRLIFPLVCSIGFKLLVPTSAWAAGSNVWERSTRHPAKERYIPVELWTRAEWDGKKELKYTAHADLSGSRLTSAHFRIDRAASSCLIFLQ